MSIGHHIHPICLDILSIRVVISFQIFTRTIKKLHKVISLQVAISLLVPGMQPQRILKLRSIVPSKFPVYDRGDIEGVWVNKNVVLTQVIVTEHKFFFM